MPVILKVEGSGTDTNLLKLADNQEIGFPEDVVWPNHYVCECNGIIYDPIYPKPLKRKEYLKSIFPKQKTKIQKFEAIKKKGRG